MKLNINLYILCIFLLLSNACQRDFDELNDTNQRHITFHFKTDSLFSSTLLYDGTYQFKSIDTLPADSRLRITAFCYDADSDTLIYSTNILATTLTDQQLTVRHLLKKTAYQFVFVADIVTYDPFVDYYETWFQLGTKKWDEFYFHSDKRQENAIYNVLGTCTILLEPDNQETDITFQPISYNGYCIFKQLKNIDRLTGYIAYCVSFNLKTLTYIQRSSLANELDYRNPEENIVKPVTLCKADSMLTFQLYTDKLADKDSLYINISNPDRRPFVATFDCEKLELESCIFY